MKKNIFAEFSHFPESIWSLNCISCVCVCWRVCGQEHKNYVMKSIWPAKGKFSDFCRKLLPQNVSLHHNGYVWDYKVQEFSSCGRILGILFVC